MFNNYTDPTTNSTQLNTTQYALNSIPTNNTLSNNGLNTTGPQYQPTNINPMGNNMGQGPNNNGFLGMGPNAFNNILGTVQVLGNLWNSFQQHRIAKEQLALSREAFETNLRNNTQTYNTALEDRIRSRYHSEGRNASDADAYLNEHSL